MFELELEFYRRVNTFKVMSSRFEEVYGINYVHFFRYKYELLKRTDMNKILFL